MSITAAKAHLAELIRRAEAGDEIIFTRHGPPAVRLVPVHPATDANTRRALLEEVRASGRRNLAPGPGAARSQDFLYGENVPPE